MRDWSLMCNARIVPFRNRPLNFWGRSVRVAVAMTMSMSVTVPMSMPMVEEGVRVEHNFIDKQYEGVSCENKHER